MINTITENEVIVFTAELQVPMNGVAIQTVGIWFSAEQLETIINHLTELKAALIAAKL